MKLFTLSTFALALSLVLTSSAAFAQETESGSNLSASAVPAASGETAKPRPLQGGVEHSEVMPELIDDLRPGKVYKDSLLLKNGTQTNNLWFRIPNWYAGVRHSENIMILYRYNYKTGITTTPNQRQLERQETLSGFQTDKNGGIWDFKHIPSIHPVESDFVNAVLFVKSLTPLKVTDDQFVVRYEEISISMDKRSNRILLVTQQEQINSVTLAEPGLLRIDTSVKSFGWDGQPQRKEESVSFAKIVKPYEQIDKFEGQDLKPLFKDYLISQHLESLVPDNLK